MDTTAVGGPNPGPLGPARAAEERQHANPKVMIGFITDALRVPRTDGGQVDGEVAADADPSKNDAIADKYVTEDELVERLIQQIRFGEVTEDQRTTLRDHLVVDVPERVEVRISHLQSKVGQLEAYTSAIEEFIDEEGTAERLLEDVRGDVTQLEEELSGVRDRVEEVEADGRAIDAQLDAMEGAVAELEEFVSSLEGRHSREIAGVDAKVDDLGETVEDLGEDVTHLETQIEALDDVESALEALEDQVAAFEGLADRVTELETLAEAADVLEALPERVSALEALEDAVDDLADETRSHEDRLDDLSSLETDVDDIGEEVSELRQLRGEVEDLRSLSDRIDALDGMREEVAAIQDDIDRLLTFRRKLIDSVTEPPTASTGD